VVNLTTDGSIQAQTPLIKDSFGKVVSDPDGNAWLFHDGTLAKATSTGAYTEFPGVYLGGYLKDFTAGPAGALWMTTSADQVVEVSTAPAVAGTFQLNKNNGNPVSIATGSDGALWIANDTLRGSIARMTTSGAATLFPLPPLVQYPSGIIPGPDGALWFEACLGGFSAGDINRLTTDGTLSQVLSLGNCGPASMTWGPDGNLWFPQGGSLVRMTPAGATTTFASIAPNLNFLTSGPDGKLWAVSEATSSFDVPFVYSITTNGNASRFPFPNGLGLGPMAFGADNNLWVSTGFDISRITLNGNVSHFVTPGVSPHAILRGSDGAMWFAGCCQQPIVRVASDGTLTKVNAHITSYGIGSITNGPDGKLWFTETVFGVPPAPNFFLVGRISEVGGVVFLGGGITPGNTIVASFVDGTPQALASDFTALIDWGDGTTSPGAVSGPQGGPFTVSGSHSYQAAKSYEVSVTLHDQVDNADYTAVGDVPLSAGSTIFPSGSCVEGAGCQLTLGSFTDADPNATVTNYVANVDWGDGYIDKGAINTCGQEFCVSDYHIFLAPGMYKTKILVTDVGGARVDLTGINVNVTDAPLSPGTTVFQPGSCAEGAGCQFTLGSFTDANPYGAVDTYTASIDWGDGTTSPGTISACGKEFCISADHVFAEAGSYNTKIAVADVGGAALNMPGIAINIADVPMTAHSATPASPHGVQFTEVIATFKDANPLAKAGDFTASIDWGDATSSPGTITANASHGFDVTGTHTYADPGPHTATVTINDIGGSTTNVQSVVADDYQITATGRRFHVRLGQPFTDLSVATCTDTDPASDVSSLTATIDWGDGTTPTSGVLVSHGGGSYDVQGSHTYTKVFGKDVTVQINHVSGSGHAVATSTIRLWPRTEPF
jgi:streptogramin lyase